MRPTLVDPGNPELRIVEAAHLHQHAGTRSGSTPRKRVDVDENTVRAMITDHFDASVDDIVRASEIYADDAVLEFPQGRERIRGKADIIAFRSAYPARLAFDIRRTTGCQDLWVNEYTIRYDDAKPVHVVGIMEFRDGTVVRERIYFGEPWDPPAWRARRVESTDEGQGGPPCAGRAGM